MKWFAIFLFVLLAGSVYAEVDSVSSGIFRGSMRHLVTIDAQDVITNVNAGDFISFRFSGEKYIGTQGAEEADIYIRRYDLGKGMAFYDIGQERYQELSVGQSITLDVNEDGTDDVVLTLRSLDRKGVFVVEDSAQLSGIPGEITDSECDIGCFTDQDCSLSEECVFPGTCESSCEARGLPATENEEENQTSEQIDPPSLEAGPEDASVDEEPVEKPGLFTRFWNWLAKLF